MGKSTALIAQAAESDSSVAHALNLTSLTLAKMAQAKDVTFETWRQELRGISLSAAANGDFKSAVDGYQYIGKSLGTLTERPSQHVHFHDIQAVREMPTEDLMAELKNIKTVPVEEPDPASEDPDMEGMLQ